MRRYLEHFLDLCKNRIFVMLCGVIVLFAIIVLRLFFPANYSRGIL